MFNTNELLSWARPYHIWYGAQRLWKGDVRRYTRCVRTWRTNI